MFRINHLHTIVAINCFAANSLSGGNSHAKNLSFVAAAGSFAMMIRCLQELYIAIARPLHYLQIVTSNSHTAKYCRVPETFYLHDIKKTII